MINMSENIAKNGLLFKINVKEEGMDDVRELLIKLNYYINEIDKTIKQLNDKKLSFDVEVKKVKQNE